MNYHKESKYHNKPCVVDGMRFDSRKEARRYGVLCLLRRAGEIKDLQRQVRFQVIPKQDGECAAYYIADFTYYEKQGAFQQGLHLYRLIGFSCLLYLLLVRYRRYKRVFCYP